MKIKNKISGAARQAFLGSVMRQSANYLPLTNRERAMVRWFLKFSFSLIFVMASWAMPISALNGHVKHVRDLEAKLSVQEASAQEKPILGATEEDSDSLENYSVASETIREVTAYNVGDPAQTDASPCIAANGEDICAAVAAGYKRCAANFVPLGTDLLISTPDGSWQFHCKVTDRMNSKYPNRVDVAMSAAEKERAVKFGLQNLIVKILEKK